MDELNFYSDGAKAKLSAVENQLTSARQSSDIILLGSL